MASVQAGARMLTKTVSARWLRIREAAEYAGVTHFFMRDLVRKRVIVPVIVGKRYVIDARDVDAYIERQKKEQTKA